MSGFHFRETMTGSLSPVGDPSVVWRVQFRAAGRAYDTQRFFSDATVELDGDITLDGVCERAPLRGTLEMSLLRKRCMVYHFKFRDAAGHDYELLGVKRLTLRGMPFGSATLFSTLTRDGRPFAQGVIYFDLLNDSLKFAASWKPGPGHDAPGPLDESSRAALTDLGAHELPA